MKKTIKFTKEGYDAMHKELDELQEKRKEAVRELAIARDMGDRSENGAYKAARWKLSGIDSRLRYLKKTLHFAEVVTPPPSGLIGIGSKVQLLCNDITNNYTIVGGHESDLTQGKLSCFSPIGKALMHHKEGDEVKVQTPAGEKVFRILKVE